MSFGRLDLGAGFCRLGAAGKSKPPIVLEFTTVGPISADVPAGCHTVLVETWGAGGGGSGGSDAVGDGPGGGGYSAKAYAVTPGQTIYGDVGAPGLGGNPHGTDGGDTSVNINANSKPVVNTDGIVAPGGKGANDGAGAGGIPTLGDINYHGGAGGGFGAGIGGGGGAGASSNDNGADAVSTTGGVAGLDGGAGSDGDGGAVLTTGQQPGGGGGSSWNNTGSNGGAGKIRLTFLGVSQFLPLGYFDTTGLVIGGYKMAYAKQLSNGNLLYCQMRGLTAGNVGVVEVNPNTREVVFSYTDAGWSDSNTVTFTGTRNSASQITASSVTGILIPGQRISGTGIPAGTTITGQISGTDGGAGVYSTSQDTTASGAAVTAKEYAGPECAFKYSNGNYLIAPVDGFQGNAGWVLAEVQPNGTAAWSWNGSDTAAALIGTNLCKPFTVGGVEIVGIFGCGLSNRRGVEFIRRDNQATLFHLAVSSVEEVSDGAFFNIGGVNYFIVVVWTSDPLMYLINYDTQTVVKSFDLGAITSSPGSGWAIEWPTSDTLHVAAAFNGTVCVITNILAWIAGTGSPQLSWKSGVFSRDDGTATPTTCFQALSNGWQALITSRSGVGAPGIIYQSMIGPSRPASF